MDPLLSTALEAAEAAAQVHLRYFGVVGLEGAQEKGHSDFVSQVDLEAQEAALEVIRTRHPDHGILAEEETEAFGGTPGDRERSGDCEFLWIVDPLDGTTNYLHGHPQFAASIGVGRWCPGGPGGEDKIVLEAGAVNAPKTGETWWAKRGEGAYKNGQTVQVSALQSMRTALVGTGFPFKKPELVARYVEEFQRVLPASGGVRRAGSAALDLCYLAEGILDGFWEEDYLSPWDVAAGLVILSEAGGVATRIDGSDIDLENGSVLGANSSKLLADLGALVRGE